MNHNNQYQAQPPKVRLDHYLAKLYPDISRAYLQKLCSNDEVLVDGVPQKAGYKLKDTDKVTVAHDMGAIGKPPDIELPVLYEDKDVLVIDKPSGVLAHGLSKFHDEPSVASFLRVHAARDPNGHYRAGIVHRLDRATSGIMICAKTEEATRMLMKQFADRTVEKVYIARVEGRPKDDHAIIDVPLGRNPKAPATWKPDTNGKAAQTEYKVLQSTDTHSLIELRPKTGRTHQLRVHLQYIGCPIQGDVLYGKASERLYLHAAQLKLQLPNGKVTTFESPVPDSFYAPPLARES